MTIDQYWLCNYSPDVCCNDWPSNLKSLWDCTWLKNLENSTIREILLNNFKEVDSLPQDNETLLVLAVSALQAFVQQNFVGPSLSLEGFAFTDGENKTAESSRKYLISNSEEINVNVSHPELLALAKYIFLHLESQIDNFDESYAKFVIFSWLLRYYTIHQLVIDENADTLYNGVLRSIDALLALINAPDNIDQTIKVSCLLEIVSALLQYKLVVKAKDQLDMINKMLNVSLVIEGKLGIRTKYQQKPLPQLLLRVESENPDTVVDTTTLNESIELPSLLLLEDDVRLQKIQFVDDADNSTLRMKPVIQALVLGTFKYIQRAQPKDKLAEEELMPYLTTLLHQEQGSWPIRISALLENIIMEATHKRTVERSLKQCEQIFKLVTTSDSVRNFHSLSFAYASYMRPVWSIKSQLGDLMVSLGLIKTALDLYLSIQRWEAVITCYTILELQHKAAEVIQNELKKKETVELYCLLGDALDEKRWYEKAWEFSNGRSGRAQRHLGCYYFSKKKYEEAIPHLEKSLTFNSLQETVWARLGYSALALERWELAAKAYRHYTNIEPNGFESWNNLAKAYLNLGDKRRAHKILNEALRCNYDNWKVWENFLIVSVDTGNFEDVLNAHHRLIELKSRYLDKEILAITVNAICNDTPDAEGRPSKRLLKKAQTQLAQLCVQYPAEGVVFELSAKLLENEPLQQAQKLQKAYRAYTQTHNLWTKTLESTVKLLNICSNMCTATLKAYEAMEESNKNPILSQMSTTRLTTQGCIKAAKDSEWSEQIQDELAPLTERLEAIKAKLMANV